MNELDYTISIPPLKSRSLKERFDLIEMFLNQEAKQIQCSIQLANTVLHSLMLYECSGQIKELKNDCGYNYAAMGYTLWYCKEVLNKPLKEKYGVSLIKYYYEDAKNYYAQQENLKKQIDKLSDAKIKTKIVKHISMNSDNRSSLINLDELLKGGDSN